MTTHLRMAIGLAMGGLLAGCGGSGMSTSAKTPPAAVDAFTQSVQAVVATTGDTALPMGVDGIAASGSESALPVVL